MTILDGWAKQANDSAMLFSQFRDLAVEHHLALAINLRKKIPSSGKDTGSFLLAGRISIR